MVSDLQRVLAARMAGPLDPESAARVDWAKARLAGALGMLQQAEDILLELLGEELVGAVGEDLAAAAEDEQQVFDLEAGSVQEYKPGVSLVRISPQGDLWPAQAEAILKRRLYAYWLQVGDGFSTHIRDLANVVDAPDDFAEALAQAIAALPEDRLASLEAASVGWGSPVDYDAAAAQNLKLAMDGFREQLKQGRERLAGEPGAASMLELLENLEMALGRA